MLVYASIELSTSPNNSQFTGNSIYVPLLLFVPLYWDLMSNRTLAEYISSSAVTARILRNLSDLDLLTEKEKKRKETLFLDPPDLTVLLRFWSTIVHVHGSLQIFQSFWLFVGLFAGVAECSARFLPCVLCIYTYHKNDCLHDVLVEIIQFFLSRSLF